MTLSQPGAPPARPDQRRLKRVAVGLNLLLIALLLAGFLYFGDTARLLAILRSARWSWFALALVTTLLSNFLSSARLWLLMRTQGLRIRLLELYSINLGVRFYSFFSPFSTVGSVVRWIRLVPASQSAEGLAALGANRLFEIAIPLAMGAFWMSTSFSPGKLSPWAVFGFLALVLLSVWAVVRFSADVARKLTQLEASASARPARIVLHILARLLASAARYRTLAARQVLVLVGLALLSDIIGLLGHILVARSIDLPLHFTDIGWIRAMILLVALAPFTLPGGFGLREVSTVVLVSALGVKVEAATAFSLLLYARLVLAALMGGAVELLVNLRTIRTGFSP